MGADIRGLSWQSGPYRPLSDLSPADWAPGDVEDPMQFFEAPELGLDSDDAWSNSVAGVYKDL